MNLLWSKTGLPTGKKATLTYAEGLVVTGTGNGWAEYYGEDWKQISAYRVEDGSKQWTCDLSEYGFRAIYNIPWFNGYFYAETQDVWGYTSKLFRINAANGKLVEVLDYGFPHTSCAQPLIAYGMLFSGDGLSDRIIVTKLAEKGSSNWPGPFGDPQLNHNAAVDPSAETVKMSIIQQ